MMEKQKDITLAKRYSDRDIIRRTLHYMKPVKWLFVLGVVLILLDVAFSVAMPRIIGYYMDAIDESTMLLSGQENPYRPLWTVVVICLSYILIVIGKAVFAFFETWTLQKAGQTVIFSLRQECFEKIETFSHEQLSEIPVGRLVTRVTNDTNTLNELYSNVLVNLLKYTLTLVGIFGSMFLLNYKISLYMIGIVVMVVIATIVYRHFAQKAFSNERRQISNLNTFLSENLQGMRITQIFNQEKRKKKEFVSVNGLVGDARKRVIFVFAVYRPFVTLMYYLAIAMVFLLGMQEVQEGAIFLGSAFTIGSLTSYYNYTASFFGPIENLAEVFDKLQAGIVSSQRIFNILDMQPTVVDEENAREIDHFQGKIEFRHVSFAYIPDHWILKDVSFVVKPGQTVAFVGATGAGKSTILSLIVRNYDIQKGQILIDDVDIKDIKLSSLRGKIAQMLQDVFLFSGTIEQNITLRGPHITREEVEEATRYVGADHFIEELQSGLETEVAENGANFSQGQRQLLSFARTIASKPNILILDEATANIDTETEALIQSSLEKMKSIGTMLIVAHRLSTVKNADNIICLAHGQIIEQGNYAELMAKQGYYYKLSRLQKDEEE